MDYWGETVFNKLFIIGNGFDRAHHFPTAYADFRIWMEDKLADEYPDLRQDDEGHIILDEMPTVPSVVMGNHGEEIANEKQAIYMLMWLLLNNSDIGEDWRNFEEALYSLDIEAIIDDYTWLVESSSIDKDGVFNPFWEDQNYEDIANDIKVSVRMIRYLFEQWIDEIDIINVPRLSINNVMDRESLFLTFNYTETLEKIYDVPPVLIDHIHGLRYRASDYIDENSHFPNTLGELIVGHGCGESRNFNPESISREMILEETIQELRKPVETLIRKHSSFWTRLQHNNIKEIYSFGFSYAEVDLPYVREIIASIQSLHNNVDRTWYLNRFDDIPDKETGRVKNIDYEQRIRECGFMGKIDRFSVE